MPTPLDSLLPAWIGLPSDPWEGPVPVPDTDSGPFWSGLAEGRLMIVRCAVCGFWIHTPVAGCSRCLSPDVKPQQVSGRGTVYSFTVVNREFSPGVRPPYIAALVDLVEQEELRLVTNLVNVRVGDVAIGMPVRVLFHDIGDAVLALFEPEDDRG